ncbi:MAG TPA: YncE family protein [Gemmatimonadales bacterium]|nr:YncE family protein [Gemmatimonadales bacterium]
MIRSLLGSALLGATATACGSDELTSPEPTSTLVVTPGRLVLGAGMSRQLSAILLDPSGAPIAGAAVNFVSSDPSRASVSPEGLVSYTGAGSAEIRASSNGAQANVPFTGLRSGHPLGTTTSTARLPGDQRGDRPFGVAVDADGRIFISQSDSGRVAWGFYPDTDFTTGNLGGTPTSIALLGSGTALVTPSGPDANDASVIELSSGAVLAEVPLDVPAFSVVSAPDSQTAYLGTNDGRVLVFDVATSAVTGSIDLGVEKSRANHLAINAAGTMLYASSFTSGTISEIDLVSRSVARLFIVGGEPQGIAVSLDGTELYVADEAGTGHIDIYDIVGNRLEASLPSGATSGLGGAFGLALSPDGAKVYVGVINTEDPGLIQVVDPAARRIEQTINSCGRVPRRIAFGFSGGLAVIVDETGCATFVE